MFILEILALVDSAGPGFIISELGFCSDLLCWQGSSLLCFGLIGVPFLGMIGSTVLVGCVSAVVCGG